MVGGIDGMLVVGMIVLSSGSGLSFNDIVVFSDVAIVETVVGRGVGVVGIGEGVV